MTKITISRDSLIDALVNYEMAKYASTMHIHLKINEDGELYIYEDTSYVISESEFNGGYPKVLKHSQGWGDYPEGYSVEDYDSEADLVDNLKSNTYDIMCDLVDDEIKELKKEFSEISFED